MPQVNFGTKDEPSFQLELSNDLIAVRTRSRRSIRGVGPVRPAHAADVDDGALVAEFPEAGIEVYRVPVGAGKRSLDDRKRSLRTAPDTRFAGGVLVDPDSGEPVLYTENVFVKFKDDVDPDDCRRVIREAGLSIKEELDYATNAFFTGAVEGTGRDVFAIAQDLFKRSDVEFCHPELVRPKAQKAIAPQQWHLKPTSVGGVSVNAHANVEAAHLTTRGEGITIAIIDDGVDIDHPEFGSSGKVIAPRDVTSSSDDPRPKDTFNQADNHGTACAGVACADGNFGASGVAPKSRLMPIRLASGLGSQSEANAFKWAADHGADVISCSWGPTDGAWFRPSDPAHNQVVHIPASTRLAIDYAIATGRGGKGCVILFAAGNGNERVENDGYASYPKVMAIAACNDRGKRSVYSDFGAAVWCAFPSSDFGHAPFGHPDALTSGVWTTDRVGTAGYNSGHLASGDGAGNYTNDFGGTSSSAPGAAGVAALVLAANPALKWNEVRDIFRRASERIDPQDGAYDVGGHSDMYGYGRINARTAVELAHPQPTSGTTVTGTFNAPIPDLHTVEFALTVSETAPLESLSVRVDLKHTYIGDLVITLVPPSSTGVNPVVLHNRSGGATKNIKKTYEKTTTPGLGAFANVNCAGTWKLRIQDAAALDSGTLVSYALDLQVPHADRLPMPEPLSRARVTTESKPSAPAVRRTRMSKKVVTSRR